MVANGCPQRESLLASIDATHPVQALRNISPQLSPSTFVLFLHMAVAAAQIAQRRDGADEAKEKNGQQHAQPADG